MQCLRKVHVGVSLVQCNGAVIRTYTDRDRVPIAMLLVLEPRHLSRPSYLDGGDEGRHDEWQFQLVSYLTAIHLHFADVTVDVALRTHHTGADDMPPVDEGKEDLLLMFPIIARCIKSRPLGDDGGGQSRCTRGAKEA